MADTNIAVLMKGITKVYPNGIAANQGVDFSVKKGEIHALMGENGAGKSTLMKMLFGLEQPTEGEIVINGEPVNLTSPTVAISKGIGMVHQHFMLVPSLTVAENIFIGREPSRGLFLNQGEQNRMTEELLSSLHLNIDARTQIKRLTVAKQQMVEIAKALSYQNTKVLIMDEPSTALTASEIEDLFTFIRQLKATGVGIVYISHRMDELKQITDRITVMRDGQYVDTVNTADTTIDQVVQMMVGRVIYEEPKSHSNVPPDAEVVLEAEGLTSLDVKNVSFKLHKGEILGFAGLMGAGRTETMRLLCGADRRDSGTIRVRGKEVNIRSPKDAVNAGIGYLSEDRKLFGLCLGLSVADNTALPSLDKLSGPLFVDDGKIHKAATEYVDKIRIKTPTVKTLIRSLSGGNQQKVVIAKWLHRDCDVLIFDEPTKGIDVGAKSEIYKLMNQLAAEGKSIIMISSELPELLRMSDRVVVMCEGRVTGELDISEATQERIMTFATKRELEEAV